MRNTAGNGYVGKSSKKSGIEEVFKFKFDYQSI